MIILGCPPSTVHQRATGIVDGIIAHWQTCWPPLWKLLLTGLTVKYVTEISYSQPSLHGIFPR